MGASPSKVWRGKVGQIPLKNVPHPTPMGGWGKVVRRRLTSWSQGGANHGRHNLWLSAATRGRMAEIPGERSRENRLASHAGIFSCLIEMEIKEGLPMWLRGAGGKIWEAGRGSRRQSSHKLNRNIRGIGGDIGRRGHSVKSALALGKPGDTLAHHIRRQKKFGAQKSFLRAKLPSDDCRRFPKSGCEIS